MELSKIKAYINTISLPVRLVAIIKGQKDSFLFDGKTFPEGLEAVYPCDYTLENEYHKEQWDKYIDGLAVEEKKEDVTQDAPRRGRPPKKSMEETIGEG